MLSKNKLDKGDHIYVHSSNYYCHGVFDGAGKVIHLSIETKTIIETPLSQFVSGRKYFLRRVEPCDLPDTIVRRAKAFLGKRIKTVTERSPEEFAVYCQCGRTKCMQLQIWAPIPDEPKRVPIRRFDSGSAVTVPVASSPWQ